MLKEAVVHQVDELLARVSRMSNADYEVIRSWEHSHSDVCKSARVLLQLDESDSSWLDKRVSNVVGPYMDLSARAEVRLSDIRLALQLLAIVGWAAQAIIRCDRLSEYQSEGYVGGFRQIGVPVLPFRVGRSLCFMSDENSIKNMSFQFGCAWGGRVDAFDDQVAMVQECWQRLAVAGPGLFDGPWHSMSEECDPGIVLDTPARLREAMDLASFGGRSAYYTFTTLDWADKRKTIPPSVDMHVCLHDAVGSASGTANLVNLSLENGESGSDEVQWPVDRLLAISAQVVKDLVDVWHPESAELRTANLLRLRPSGAYPTVGLVTWLSDAVADRDRLPRTPIFERYGDGTLIGVDLNGPDPYAAAMELATDMYEAGLLRPQPIIQSQAWSLAPAARASSAPAEHPRPAGRKVKEMDDMGELISVRAIWGGRIDPVESQAGMVLRLWEKLARIDPALGGEWLMNDGDDNLTCFDDQADLAGLLGEADGSFQFENKPADIDEDDGWAPYVRLAGSISSPVNRPMGPGNWVQLFFEGGYDGAEDEVAWSDRQIIGWGVRLVEAMVDAWGPDACSLHSSTLMNRRPRELDGSILPDIGYVTWLSGRVADLDRLPDAPIRQLYGGGMLLGVDLTGPDPLGEAQQLADAVYAAGVLKSLPTVQA